MDMTVQMNTRLGRAAKTGGDAVLAQHGLSPSQAVRALWDYLCKHQDLPSFMREREVDAMDAERQRKISLIKNGAGLAVRVAQEQCGYTGPASNLLDDADWRELKNDMYDNMLDEMEARCAYPAATSAS